jgi:hypothetical protein
MKESILLSYGFMHLDFDKSDLSELSVDAILKPHLMTFITNLMSFGYIPNKDLLIALSSLKENDINNLWASYLVALESLYGTDRKMEEFVVYKNFPQEVLTMTETTYWTNQILMYWGFQNELFTEEVKDRPIIKEKMKTKVLQLANDNDVLAIFNSLVKQTSRWNDNQEEHANYLLHNLTILQLDINEFGFKENAVNSIANIIVNSLKTEYTISTGNDVLRIAASLSNGDVSLRTNIKFRNFKRSERRLLLSLLEETNNIEDDFALKPRNWKNLLKLLHPSDYKFNKVLKAYDELYNNRCKTFDSKLQFAIDNNNEKKVSLLLKSRAGIFARKLHEMYAIYGKKTFTDFSEVVNSLNTHKLVSLKKYFETINDRKFLIIPPKGNWNKAQIIKNTKKVISKNDLIFILDILTKSIVKKVELSVKDGVLLDDKTKEVKLQTNDQKLANYGRGTSFDIPENINFIRTASFWKGNNTYNIFFDNSWNFFDANWKDKGSCCWNNEGCDDNGQTKDIGAIFSGDPTNSKDLEGRACQMIDLYIDKLINQGVRYAVWNILSYSTIPFDCVDEVFAALQWGENPEEGKLYDPRRTQMSFPVTGQNLTKYIAYIDLVERKLIYMDADLPAHIHSAKNNGEILTNTMPAFLEYLNALPSVNDIFIDIKAGETPIVYSNKYITNDFKGYCFKNENADISVDNIDINNILKK